MKTLDKNTKLSVWPLVYIGYFFCMWLYLQWVTASWLDGKAFIQFWAMVCLFVSLPVALVISGALSDSKESRKKLFHISYLVTYFIFVSLGV